MTGLDLVTGGCGFLGRHVVAALLDRGRTVRVLDVAEPGKLSGEVEMVTGSVTDPTRVAQAMDGAERVFHLAAIPELWARDASVFDRVNHRGTTTVVDAARDNPKLRCFVYTASEVVLVPRRGVARPERLDESVVLAPEQLIGAYAAAKRRGEQAVLDAAADGLPAVSVIPTMPLGPGDVNRTPPTRMIADLLAGRTPAFADVLLNVVDARDCAAGHILAAEHGQTGGRYVLSGHNVRMSALLGELSLLTDGRMPHRRVPTWLARAFSAAETAVADTLTGKPPTAPAAGVAIATRQRPFDNALARRDLGYTTRPLSVTLADTIAWLTDPA